MAGEDDGPLEFLSLADDDVDDVALLVPFDGDITRDWSGPTYETGYKNVDQPSGGFGIASGSALPDDEPVCLVPQEGQAAGRHIPK